MPSVVMKALNKNSLMVNESCRIFSHLAILQSAMSTCSKSLHPLHFFDHLVLKLKTPALAPSLAPIWRQNLVCATKRHFGANFIVRSQTSRVWIKQALSLVSFDTYGKMLTSTDP